MITIAVLIIAVIVGVCLALLFTAYEEFPDVDSVGTEYPDIDEHEDLTR